MLNLYITSPSRKCGKSFITCGLAATMQSLGYRTAVYKPVQTAGIEHNGFMQSPDLTLIKTIDPYIKTQFSYLYKADTEPLIASELEENPINLELIYNEYKKYSSNSDCTIIDGDGGILSPIAPNAQNIDLIQQLNIPLLIVTKPNKDSINNTLMTISTAIERKIDIRGVIINNIEEDCPRQLLSSIPRIIEEYSSVKVCGLVNNIGNKITPEELITAILNGVDIESLFNVKIEKLDLE